MDVFREDDYQTLQPYQALEPLPLGDDEIEGQEEVVREGTAAIRTYQEMMCGISKSD